MEEMQNGEVQSNNEETIQDNNDHLSDLLKQNLLSIRGRRRLLRELGDLDIAPTTFEDDEEPASEDEDGEEVHVLQHGVFCGQNYENLKEKCEGNGKLFVDPQFPPCDMSLALDRSVSGVEWKRPSDICEDPHFFVGGASRFDVKQGELGDCWLLAAIANLTLHKKLFARVVPPDQSFTDGYAGIFHFRY